MMPTLLGPRRIFPKREKCIGTLEVEVCTVVVGKNQELSLSFHSIYLRKVFKFTIRKDMSNTDHRMAFTLHVRPSDKLLHWPASLEVDAASR